MFPLFSTLVFNVHLLKYLISLILLTTVSRGLLRQHENHEAATSSLMTAFLLCAICMKPCYCVDPFVPPVLGWIFSQLICLLWAKERFSASARTLPCSYGEGGEPQHLVAIWFWLTCGFNHFLLAKDYPALCSLLGTDSWKWSFPSVCWDSEYLCVFEEASKLMCTWWTFQVWGENPYLATLNKPSHFMHHPIGCSSILNQRIVCLIAHKLQSCWPEHGCFTEVSDDW